MCVQDLRIADHYQYETAQYDSSSESVEALKFKSDPTRRVLIATVADLIVASGGFVKGPAIMIATKVGGTRVCLGAINSYMPTVVIDYDKVGPIMCGDIYAVLAGDGTWLYDLISVRLNADYREIESEG